MRHQPCFCTIVPPHMLSEIVKNGDPGQRAWAAQTLALGERMRGRREVLAAVPVDAPSSAGMLRRTVFDARGQELLPGDLVWAEGNDHSQDREVREAADGAGITYAFLRDAYGRNSIDDRGLALDSTVHYGKGYDNAFWDGRQMVYGDGDGKLFQPFTRALDVIGHEFTHGVIQSEANLSYWSEHGALNESFADVFGILVRQYHHKEDAAAATWLIGSELLTPQVNGRGLRSLAAPGTAYDDPVLGKDPQPKHMKDYQDVNHDTGGVHINSGIPNHAFYLAATQIGGYAWEKTGKIWYIVLRDRLKRRATFRDAAIATIKVAAELYGARSIETKAVRKAWVAVGVPTR